MYMHHGLGFERPTALHPIQRCAAGGVPGEEGGRKNEQRRREGESERGREGGREREREGGRERGGGRERNNTSRLTGGSLTNDLLCPQLLQFLQLVLPNS